MKKLGIYVHIPFCFRKCYYCDFLSFGESAEKEQEDYFSALIEEIEYYGQIYRNRFYVDTVFIGGGTPSLVHEALIADLMSAIRANFTICPDAEITIESNPKTLTENKLTTYFQGGINRLSMGVQSLNADLLKRMGRIHTVEDVLENYQMARACGFKNINMDLIFSIPGMTTDIWQNTLENVLALKPEHLSFYSLQLEEDTPFFKEFEEGRLQETSDELDRQLYGMALDYAKAEGFEHYEISNAAKHGLECKHNLKYWSLDDYLGLGLGSHSYVDGCRFSNLRDLKSYENAGKESFLFDPNQNPFLGWYHENTRQDTISEYLFTGMRKMEGIDLLEFEQRFQESFQNLYGKELDRFIADQLVEIVDGKMRFTRRGIDVSNKILAEFV